MSSNHQERGGNRQLENVPNRPHQPYGIWPIISGLWVLMMLVTTLQEYLVQGSDFHSTLRFAMAHWLPWVVLTPGVTWLCAVFTLERGLWKKRLAVHLAVCSTISLALGEISYRMGPPPALRKLLKAEALVNFPHSISDIFLRFAPFQFPIYWAIVGLTHASLFYDRARERERHAAILESHLNQSRLQTLQMQLNPHFLFNTLNSIASLIHENPRMADEMVASLSEFLRLTLKTSDHAELTLREELVFVENYLAIEQVRFGARLQVEKQIETEALSALVPVLLLQPLVENSIKHGLEKQLAPIVVRITARRENQSLLLEVADNSRNRIEPATWHEGVGLANTRARLRETAGAAASLDLRLSAEGGLIAAIKLPWRCQTTPDPAAESARIGS